MTAMSARASKKLNKFSKQPAKRASAKDHPKRPTSSHASSSSIKKVSKPVKGHSVSPKAGKPPVKGSGKAQTKPKSGASKQKPQQVQSRQAVERGKRSQRPESKHTQKPAQKAKLDNKALAKSRASEKKAREAAKKLEQQLRQRDAKLKAELKRKEAEQKKKEQDLLAQQKRKAADLKKKEVERRAEQKRKEAERSRLALEAQKAREAEQKARELEKARVAAEKAAAKEVQRKAAEDEKLRRLQEREAARLAKEQERAQQKAQREAEREEARRIKEEERAKREAEREAYRKAKEAEREKIRAAKEAARRALEGRIAEQNRNANKLGGGRSSTTRIYSPRAIPDQSGTTRRLQAPLQLAQPTVATVNESEPPLAPDNVPAMAAPSPTPLPPALGSEPPSKPPSVEGLGTGTPEEEAARAAERAQPVPENVEDRYRVIEERLKAAPDNFNRDYKETIDMSWIHHDSALEGVVYTFQELKSALDPTNAAITDSSLQPVVEEIRRHKQAIDLVRDLGERKRAPITVDTIKKIYVTLHPEEGDIKTVKYRRDIPQHRLYFHEYAHPEKITYKVRQVVDWFNGPEPKKLKSPIRVAARVHYELLRIFPFQTDSGKVARLMMNLILMRAGHPPAIIHSTERQRYYEALKGALPVLVQMVTESIMNSLMSIEKLLDEHDIRLRA